MLRKKFPYSKLLSKRARRIISELHSGALDGISSSVEDIISESILASIASAISSMTERCVVKEPQCTKPLRTVYDAEDILFSHPDKRISVAHLASELGVSQRTLFRLFKAETGTSPHEFLSRFRMTQARLDLASSDPQENSVTRIAQEWGFWELGRFSVDYKSMFGESPRETLLNA